MPVSLGKKSTPSSSGTMVVMEKQETTVFDTRAELGPDEGYRTDIEYAQRLTWGGEYIHSAPWSVRRPGAPERLARLRQCVARRTPAGCSTRPRIGDPITVKGTERKLAHGNGWTAWNLSWDKFVKGSALPVPAGSASSSGATSR